MEILPLSSDKVLSRITSTDSEEITTIICDRSVRGKYLVGYGQNMTVGCSGILSFNLIQGGVQRESRGDRLKGKVN